MYHLDVNGKRVTNLRLSPDTSRRSSPARSRTGTTRRSRPTTRSSVPEPADQADRALRRSGTTAQFTAFMAKQTPASGTRSAQRVGFERQPVPADVAVARHQRHRRSSSPTASPTTSPRPTTTARSPTSSTATRSSAASRSRRCSTRPATTCSRRRTTSRSRCRAHAQPRRTQNLGGVYNNPDPRAYPISSYSYMIVPTTTAKPFTPAKGTTLGKFILYFVCAGQQKAAQLGYSPLPKNLVQFGVRGRSTGSRARRAAADRQCDNPTITGGFITGKAPPPPASAKKGFAAPASSNPVNADSGATASQSNTGTTATTVAGVGTGLRTRRPPPTRSRGRTDLVLARGPIRAPAPTDPAAARVRTWSRRQSRSCSCSGRRRSRWPYDTGAKRRCRDGYARSRAGAVAGAVRAR